MKMCDECGLHPANIHLTQIVENGSQSFHLCEECAEKRGIHISIDEEAIGGEPRLDIPDDNEDFSCEACGTTLGDFRNKGLLGCPSCYNFFENEIEELLLNVHGSSQHKGKKYRHQALPKEPSSGKEELAKLENKLDAAIKNEEFERAALLRDTIHGLKDSKQK
jgi:protein arginine kinase activator